MKKLLLIALALISIEGIAQQKMQRPQRKEIAQKMIALSPEESAGLQTKRMTLFLDLNKFQQKEIYKMNLENATKRESAMEANKAKRESDIVEKPTKKEYLSKVNARLDNQIARKIKMNFILTSDQYTKWEEIQTEMKHRFKKGMLNKRFAQNTAPFKRERI